MSADRWSICPRCLKKRDTAFNTARKAVQAQYGKVSAAEFLRLERTTQYPEAIEETLREDYEFSFNSTTGDFTAEYSGVCQKKECGFEFKFKEERRMFAEDRP